MRGWLHELLLVEGATLAPVIALPENGRGAVRRK